MRLQSRLIWIFHLFVMSSSFLDGRVRLPCSFLSVITDEQAMEALEHIVRLDDKLGVGVGAMKKRTKYNAIVKEWENQECEIEEEDDGEEIMDDDDEFWNESQYVTKHSSEESIAVFGGDPSRRKQAIVKRLEPFGQMDLYGTPRDVGLHDVEKLLSKIQKYDVVYSWTRFNCHTSRIRIRNACRREGIRFEEVQSLSLIREDTRQR